MQEGSFFDAEDTSLKNLYFGQRKFRVPRYQRPYTWGVDEMTDFWEDINQEETLLFFGSFIFNIENEMTDGYADIIDGQQRLLSITILASVIRDLTKKFDQKTSDLCQRHDIGIEDENGKFAFRILPSESLENYFQKFIQSGEYDIFESIPQSVEEKKVKANYEFLTEKISAILSTKESLRAKQQFIETLRKKMRELLVINISVSKEDDAYDIFETTNARGMELTVGDLLKNLVFKNLKSDRGRDSAKEIWKEVERNIEETNSEMKKFVRYFWLSKYGFVPERRLYKDIKTRIGKGDWLKFLEDLQITSQIYNSLIIGNLSDFSEYGEHYSDIFESISAIRLMGVSQCYVLFLSILRNYPKLGRDPHKIFKLIENFTFQYSVICKLPSNRVEKIFSKYAILIEKALELLKGEKLTRRLNTIFSNFESEIISESPQRSQFLESFADLSYKKAKDTIQLITYILTKIDISQKSGSEYIVNLKTVNIEHLLPVNPEKDWNLSKQDIRNYVNKLGNLTLLSKELNSKIKNGIIQKKLPELRNSEIVLTKELVRLFESNDCVWNEVEINKRHSTLAEIAYEKVWNIEL